MEGTITATAPIHYTAKAMLRKGLLHHHALKMHTGQHTKANIFMA